MRQLLICLVSAATLACANTQAGPISRVRFEIRGLTDKATDGQFSTGFAHEATVVAIGDSAASHEPYVVVIALTHLSGGDPDIQRASPRYAVVFVTNGVGELSDWAGSRSKKTSYSQGETWEPEKVEASIVGAIPIAQVAPVSVRER